MQDRTARLEVVADAIGARGDSNAHCCCRINSVRLTDGRLGLPVVGHLPELRRNKPADADAPAGFDPSLVTAVRPKSAEAEAYRGLRTQVFKSAEANGTKVLQVTSPCPD